MEPTWVKVPIEGSKPPPRYGHVCQYFKPFIIVFGGNVINEPNNDVWVLSIEEKQPFSWYKIEFSEAQP